jgi:hypothetical protein
VISEECEKISKHTYKHTQICEYMQKCICMCFYQQGGKNIKENMFKEIFPDKMKTLNL